MCAVFDALSPAQQAKARSTKLLGSYQRRLREGPPLSELSEDERRRAEVVLRRRPDVEHPLVRRHLPTGRETLYLGDTLSLQPVGLSFDEGRQWMDNLFRHATDERFVYKHVWEQHDIVLWDNRRMMYVPATVPLITHYAACPPTKPDRCGVPVAHEHLVGFVNPTGTARVVATTPRRSA